MKHLVTLKGSEKQDSLNQIFFTRNEVKGQGQSSTDIACSLIFETCDNSFDVKSYHTLKKSTTENTLECQGHENVGQGHHEPNTS